MTASRKQLYNMWREQPVNSKKRPNGSDNFNFLIDYQLNWMYGRYFMWNFVGRQNDIQGHGSILHGNWISGINFIDKAKSLILENISNEHFGVSELADAMHMSRSNLLRKIKKQTQQSASQFIRQIRLTEAMALLKDSSMTVSEVSYQVGFGSTSYFIKCFRETYGYPPGEVGKVEIKKDIEELTVEKKAPNPSFLKTYKWPIVLLSAVILSVLVFLFASKSTTGKT